MMMMLLWQAGDHVLVNSWLSKSFICFLLLSSRTSSFSRQMAATTLTLMTRSTLSSFQTFMFDSYRDPDTNAQSPVRNFSCLSTTTFTCTLLATEIKLGSKDTFLRPACIILSEYIRIFEGFLNIARRAFDYILTHEYSGSHYR